MKNKWKIGFLVLLAINFIIVAVILISVLTPPKDTKIQKLSSNEKDYVSFYIKSNKEDLNQLIQYYLKKEAPKSPIDYHIVLADEVELYGSIPFFGDELKMRLTFEPQAKKNGDLVLKQKSISVGRLHLPVPYVMKMISDNYKLPRGVQILPDDRMVYIRMQDLKLKSDAKVKVNKFNLKKDDISFDLLVPVK